MSNWQLLVISLTGRKAASRMRLWRGLRASGAAVLRDGVYVLPAGQNSTAFAEQAEIIRAQEGMAMLFEITAADAAQTHELRVLFDRSEQFAAFDTILLDTERQLAQLNEAQARRKLNALRREFNALVTTDFFPGDAQAHSADRLQRLSASIDARYSVGEPRARAARRLPRQSVCDYQARIWATRKHLWVDRVASAWLIRRFIDAQAQFLWLDSPEDCPADALGFDFDGATFTHVGDKVTFEVLLESFGLDSDNALTRLAALVHYLDVGGKPAPEADGFTAILTGARTTLPDDDALLAQIGGVLDNLYSAFSES